MSFADYLEYKKQYSTPDKFTLKPPKGLTEKEAMYIVSAISSFCPDGTLPKDKEFFNLNNTAKREILAKIFDKSENAYPYASSIFKRYVLNSNIYPNYPDVPFSKHLQKNRYKVFEKARNIAYSYYQVRNYQFSANTQQYNIPMIYCDGSKDWFKELQSIPKTQLYIDGEAKNISQIAQEYKEEMFNSCFTKQFKNKVFFFPIEAVDKNGKYYSFLKQIEITKSSQTDDLMVSISVSAIPKNNAKYSHQILRIDSGGYHANSLPKEVLLKNPSNTILNSKVKRTERGDNITFIPQRTNGIHFHLFNKESNIVYFKNPSTADAIGIEDVVNMWRDLDYFKTLELHPCLQQLVNNSNEAYSQLFKLMIMEKNFKDNNYSTTMVEDYLNDKHLKLPKHQIVDASKFLYTLDMLECMDRIVDLCLNISAIPVAFNDKEYIKQLKDIGLENNAYKSNKDVYNCSDDAQILNNSTNGTENSANTSNAQNNDFEM